MLKCSPVNLLHIFRTAFSKNTSEWLLLESLFIKVYEKVLRRGSALMFPCEICEIFRTPFQIKLHFQ